MNELEQRMYEEEKARAVAAEKVKKEMEAAAQKQKNKGCLIATAIFGGLIFIGIIVSAVNPSKPKAPVEIVHNSEYDGSVRQVAAYLKANLKDPDSYQSIEWSPVSKVDLPQWKYIVRHKYRAKNSFGGYVIDEQLFYLDGNGNVVHTKKYR